MEPISINLNCDLREIVRTRRVKGCLFTGDNGGNIINVNVYEDGKPVNLAGWTVTGKIIKPNGTMSSSISGGVSQEVSNRAYLVLPSEAYALSGDITIFVKMTKGTTNTTIAAIVVNVFQSSTGTVIGP